MYNNENNIIMHAEGVNCESLNLTFIRQYFAPPQYFCFGEAIFSIGQSEETAC